MYAADRKEGYVIKAATWPHINVGWCERWNIKSMRVCTQAICFSRRRGPVKAHLTLKGRNIPFVKDVKYLGVIFYRKITWRPHLDSTATKAF